MVILGGLGVANDADYILVRNCYFEDNHADNPTEDSGGMGGAIDSHGSYGNYINCTFVGNSAVLRGGAIGFLVGHDNTVLECTFINNTSPVGGALYG